MENTLPLVSVVIPAYNVGSFIENTVESVLKQSFKDFEVIVINDGSTDSTAERLNAFADARLFVHHIANQGVSHARNLGISLARGKYIAFLDGDDVWSPIHLQSAVDFLRLHPEVSWWSSCSYSGEVPRSNLSASGGNTQVRSYYGAPGLAANSSTIVLETVTAKALHPLFPENMRNAEDWAAWLSYADVHPDIAFWEEPEVLYRTRAGSATQSESKVCTQLVEKYMAFSHHMSALNARVDGEHDALRTRFFRMRALERWIIVFSQLDARDVVGELRRQKEVLGMPLYVILKLMTSVYVVFLRTVCRVLGQIHWRIEKQVKEKSQ